MCYKKGCRENQNAHFTVNNIFFFENLTVYDIRCKTFVEVGRPQGKMWLKRVLDTKATNTFPLQKWLHKNASILTLYLHCLPCSPIVSLLLKTQKSLSSCKNTRFIVPKMLVPLVGGNLYPSSRNRVNKFYNLCIWHDRGTSSSILNTVCICQQTKDCRSQDKVTSFWNCSK